VRNTKVWLRLLGLVRTVLEGVVFDEDSDAMVVSVRPRKGARQRCGRCGRRAAWYDRGEGRRRWRSLDLGELRCFLEADAPRVSCPEHGPTVIQVPWARHGAGHTLAFDDQVAWLATHTSKTAVAELMRIAWRSVGAIITRVVADARAASDPFEGLQRIGIDEVSYGRGFKFLTVVVDHDSGRLVWAAPGKERRTLEGFFDLLGEERCGRIRLVSADGAEYIAGVVAERCPNATVCADPFHVDGRSDQNSKVRLADPRQGGVRWR
jgi:transposase